MFVAFLYARQLLSEVLFCRKFAEYAQTISRAIADCFVTARCNFYKYVGIIGKAVVCRRCRSFSILQVSEQADNDERNFCR